ncbi:hypothetical protein CDD81_4683 [Ophiocordyceps australis]|uniref:Uncharacterized protein n=1 Tax=Ophiocordyceps australis TaxID=1399860 RepID=A0A2C5Y9D4_9HYPO|nr:hypothetical protein CDD81_4683 [Ophiocordyceps australis]
MQSWPDQSQNGPDSHDAWQSFTFADHNGQYDPTQQQWSPESAFAQASHDAHDGSVPEFHFDPTSHESTVFLGEQHLPGSQPPQASFHGGHGSMPFDQHQQFSHSTQDLLDPAFANIQPDLFAQSPQPQTPHQSKVDLTEAGGSMGQMAMGQAPSHAHSHPQTFSQHDFSFTQQQPGQPYSTNTPSSQYDPRHLISHQPLARQPGQTPVPQHYDATNSIHAHFSQGQAFASEQPTTPRQSAQHQYAASNQSFPASSNNQAANFQPRPHGHIAYNQFQEPQPQAPTQQSQFQQSRFVPPRQQLAYQRPGLSSSQQHLPQHRQLPQQATTGHSQISPSSGGAILDFSEFDQPPPSSGESPAKKRKISNKVPPNTIVIDSPPISVDLSDSAGKRTDEIDGLEAPVPSTEEARLLAASAKNNNLVKGRASLTKALPHIAFEGSVRLPVPKSYDKLSPLVAVPSRSGRPAVAGLGYVLPCEIQGIFTSQYRPSSEKSGLDERRVEAKQLLDTYDSSMKSLGKRRPKYTEYPHAFKEQLKADEASKNKAEKKAKKELEEERGKPIRPAVRPADPAAAAAWDVSGIVHIDESLTRTSALIAGRVQQAGELLISLRGEAHRAKLALDQAIKERKPETETSKLRHAAEQKREALYQALDAVVEHADDAVLDNLGGHQKLVLNLVNTLIASIKSSDFSSKLLKIVLELFTHLSMTRKIVDTTNFDTVRKRLEDKGDDEVKDLVRQISSKIKKFIKSTEPETATGYTGTSATSRAKSSKPALTDSSSSSQSSLEVHHY